MSIYLAARLQQARRKKANAFKRGCALLSFAVTTTAALVAWPHHMNTELAVTVADIASPPVQGAEAKPSGIAAMFNQSIFEAQQELDFTPIGPSAEDIAKSFSNLRFAMLEAQTKTPPKIDIDPIRVAAISPKVTQTKALDRAEKTFGAVVQSIPEVAALDAIQALDNANGAVQSRDPSLPYPVTVPSKLAYARDNAPSLKDYKPVMTQASMDANKKQHWCLATAIYFEARGESYRGQVAVAQVVRNRVKHKAYPNSICSVVFQNQSWKNRCQFSFACDGIPERVNEKTAWKQAEEIATKVINGDIYLPEVANATHYHANYVWPKWAPKLKKLTKIGVHIFYRFRSG